MKNVLIAALAVVLVLSSCKNNVSNVKLANEADTVSYMLGQYYAKTAKQYEPENLNPAAVASAFHDVFISDTTKFTEEQISLKLNAYFTKLQDKRSKENKIKGEKFLEENRKKAGVITTPSGLQYIIIKEGTGPMPDSSDVVTVHYTGKTIDEKEFDSSVKRGQPAQFMVTQVIPGWTEALLKMKVGSKWKVFIPSNLGYGPQGSRGIQPNSTLVFDVELLGIQPKPEAPKVVEPAKPVKPSKKK